MLPSLERFRLQTLFLDVNLKAAELPQTHPAGRCSSNRALSTNPLSGCFVLSWMLNGGEEAGMHPPDTHGVCGATVKSLA